MLLRESDIADVVFVFTVFPVLAAALMATCHDGSPLAGTSVHAPSEGNRVQDVSWLEHVDRYHVPIPSRIRQAGHTRGRRGSDVGSTVPVIGMRDASGHARVPPR